ncbi:hypothetical protein Tco_1238598 [Tanacetum coccineum]
MPAFDDGCGLGERCGGTMVPDVVSGRQTLAGRACAGCYGCQPVRAPVHGNSYSGGLGTRWPFSVVTWHWAHVSGSWDGAPSGLALGGVGRGGGWGAGVRAGVGGGGGGAGGWSWGRGGGGWEWGAGGWVERRRAWWEGWGVGRGVLGRGGGGEVGLVGKEGGESVDGGVWGGVGIRRGRGLSGGEEGGKVSTVWGEFGGGEASF